MFLLGNVVAWLLIGLLLRDVGNRWRIAIVALALFSLLLPELVESTNPSLLYALGFAMRALLAVAYIIRLKFIKATGW